MSRSCGYWAGSHLITRRSRTSAKTMAWRCVGYVRASSNSAAWANHAAIRVPAGGGATTWNPSDKTASLALSGSDLVATTSANLQGVRSIAAVGASQKVYMEYVPTVNANDQQFGFANSTYVFGNILQINACGFK